MICRHFIREFRPSQPKWLLDGIRIRRGLSWTSTGRMSANGGSGSFVRSDGCTGRWTASRQSKNAGFSQV